MTRNPESTQEQGLSSFLSRVAIQVGKERFSLGAELQPGYKTDIISLQDGGRTQVSRDWGKDTHDLGLCVVFIEGSDNKIYKITHNTISAADKSTGKINRFYWIGGNPSVLIGLSFEFYAKSSIPGVAKAVFIDEPRDQIKTMTIPQVKSVTLVSKDRKLTAPGDLSIHQWPESAIPQSFFNVH